MFGIAPDSSRAYASVPYRRTVVTLSRRGRSSTGPAKPGLRRALRASRPLISLLAASASQRTNCPNVRPEGARANSDTTLYFPTCSCRAVFLVIVFFLFGFLAMKAPNGSRGDATGTPGRAMGEGLSSLGMATSSLNFLYFGIASPSAFLFSAATHPPSTDSAINVTCFDPV